MAEAKMTNKHIVSASTQVLIHDIGSTEENEV